jgi:hypothetical protein
MVKMSKKSYFGFIGKEGLDSPIIAFASLHSPRLNTGAFVFNMVFKQWKRDSQQRCGVTPDGAILTGRNAADTGLTKINCVPLVRVSCERH